MKLTFKRICPEIEVTALGDAERHYTPGPPGKSAPFALHMEDGTVLPNQVSTTLHSEPGQPAQITVVFTVDGDRLVVQGHEL